ncbi:MAG: cysteine desulfurase [Deltaproteobacteria bacterium RIFCSPLOWO2_01_44_7]|nr:MAG: cysteine desulfurase [Deltaproteobacteria bacterium RIFCSPHIGHO2_01_FULL_43_49]OGQ14478.1 MAG: cysteine desulfurase [Deltaproteobacteria bacterium RIFCSPHIGHO2_02_FULL_44_53]OGQ27859.1 MAG: cysteine desulfurase [Deltaproteobacteria bacterium RIFCSPHIGHO2_12_FULL_44_21]OGQ30935.1 MAG: cysteine desulfurase [Deltaproteobacteria bacterium RIFCSPLOWO2_01_FULL_45_74]OGQ38964.1 MAG: cysteine desulfurase [Deltaproteobacteria bacterium RIFCSPLOWO2_01_44_7]OGQ42595.1 MAG: cysteine desulfurase [D
MLLEAQKIRADFPILKRQIGGKPLVYLDNAASSQKPQSVLLTMNAFYQVSYANIHRGVYTIAEEATELYEKARETVANFLNTKTHREIIFTRGTTEAINLVRFSWGRKNVQSGDEILLTEMEHHSNLVPWQLLAQEKGAKLKFIPFDSQGKLVLDQLDSLLTDKTKLVAMNFVSNTFGTINPVEKVIAKAHAKGIPVLLDAAQAVPHLTVDVQKLDCDFLAFSSHKMLGPTGIGVLYAKEKILEAMDPFLGGGEMIKEVHWDHSTWNDLPGKFEAGTQSIAEAVGLKAAIDYLKTIGLEKIHDHEQALARYTMEQFSEMKELTFYGPPPKDRCGLVAFNLQGIHPHDVAAVLDRSGICVRAGHHCTQPLHRKLGLEASVRASYYLYNTKEEVDLLIDALKETTRFFKK